MTQSNNLAQVYQELDRMGDELRSLEDRKKKLETELRVLKKQLEKIPSWAVQPSQREIEKEENNPFTNIMAGFYRGEPTLKERTQEASRKKEIETQIINVRSKITNLSERKRVLSKDISRLEKSLQKLEDPNTHEKVGHEDGYDVGYKEGEDSLRLAAYALLEPPDNPLLRASYKARNEIIRKCKSYYEDGYKLGKRKGQRDRNDIMGQ